MMVGAPGDVTRLLDRARDGDGDAPDALFETVPAQLRAMADRRLRGAPPGAVFQPTALVNELDRRLHTRSLPETRAKFFQVAARTMRDLVAEHARAAGAATRGGGARRTPLDEFPASRASDAEVLDVDAPLCRLSKHDRIAVDVVVTRFCAGLTIEQDAEALQRSDRTVSLVWHSARAWLRSRL